MEKKKENIWKWENLARKSQIQNRVVPEQENKIAESKKFKRNSTRKFPRIERHLFSNERTHQVPSTVNEKRAMSNHTSWKFENCGSEGRAYPERKCRSNVKDQNSGWHRLLNTISTSYKESRTKCSNFQGKITSIDKLPIKSGSRMKIFMDMQHFKNIHLPCVLSQEAWLKQQSKLRKRKTGFPGKRGATRRVPSRWRDAPGGRWRGIQDWCLGLRLGMWPA